MVSSFSKIQSRSQSQVRGSARLGSARLVSPRLISKISQIKKMDGGTAATHGRVVVGLGGRFMRSVYEVGRGGRSRGSGRPWYQAVCIFLLYYCVCVLGGRVDLGIKLFKNSVSVSLRREARLGLARLVSSRLGSFPKFLR